MKPFAILLLASLLGACAGNPVHFNGNESNRRGSGNAPLEGPNANDVINDVHHDRARQNYEDRTSKRRYGRFD